MEIRLDKWLWAARFFKTRSAAKAGIDGGKVHIDGQKAKSSKSVSLGMIIEIRQGHVVKTVEVKNLSEQRRGASDAALLYEERQDSLEKRQKLQEAKRYMPIGPAEKPNKKQRRELLKFKQHY